MEALGGRIILHSPRGAGTSLRAEFPLTTTNDGVTSSAGLAASEGRQASFPAPQCFRHVAQSAAMEQRCFATQRHSKSGHRPTARLWRRGTQITKFGTAPDGPLRDRVADHIGGSARG